MTNAAIQENVGCLKATAAMLVVLCMRQLRVHVAYDHKWVEPGCGSDWLHAKARERVATERSIDLS